MKHLKIWTDGSCSGNGQANVFGAYAYEHVLVDDDPSVEEESKLRGFPLKDNKPTNNKAELRALIEAIRAIKPEYLEDKNVEVFTDSSYVAGPIQHGGALQTYYKTDVWISKSTHKEIANVEMWKELAVLLREKKQQKLFFTFTLIKGHAGDKHNDNVDKEAQRISQELRKGTYHE